MLLRIALGLSLAFLGFIHFRDAEFAMQVGAGLGVLSPLGYVWGFVLPGLYIFGGLLLVFGIFPAVAAYAAGIALASIPVGLLLKSAMGTLPLESSMPAALNAFIWLLVLAFSLPQCCSTKPTPSITSVPASRPMPPAPAMKVTSAAPVAVTPKPSPSKSAPKKASASAKATVDKPVKKVAPKPVAAKSIPVKKSPPPTAAKGGLDV